MRQLTLLLFAFACFALKAETNEPPREWIDPDTGHRIIRLSQEPESESLYFHQNAFTAAGDKMVMVTPSGISTVNLQTRHIELVVPGIPRSTNSAHGIIVGRTSRQVYYVRREGTNSVVYATHLDTHATRRIGELPGRGGSVLALNADETLLAGSFALRPSTNAPPIRDRSPDGSSTNQGPRPGRATLIARRFQERLPMRLFTIEIQTGTVRTFHDSNHWLNHVQMSPTDPSLILFCHEGPWHLLDRVWTVRTDGSGLKLIHPRTMEMEIAGHEFFSRDGQTIWYDLQTPRGEDFWLAGYEIATGRRTWYHLERNEWSVHYNISPDGTLFAGDGGSEGMVAHATDGKWIYLFRPENTYVPAGDKPSADGKLIKPGVFRSEKLVNMSRHNYDLEPNVNFTPDGKWIVFRSNSFGPAHVFAVEVVKAAAGE